MAIFIIDQFSLNTDLPLDIRYVPSAGRLDPDISVYKYPGMQVYDKTTESIWYADNSLNWVEVGSGSDASLNDLYQLIIDLSTFTTNLDTSLNTLYTFTTDLSTRVDNNSTLIQIHDTSIGNIELRLGIVESSAGFLTQWNISQDASIELINTQIDQLDASIVRIDGEISQLDSSITRIDGSINDIYIQQVIQDNSIAYNDSSIRQLFQEIGNNDASIDDLYEWNLVQDSSIEGLRGRIEIIDGSITYLTNITNIHDASIGQLEIDINAIESSLGDYVRRDGDTMTGDLIVPGVSITNDLSVGGNSVISGNLAVGGDLTIDGSLTYIHTTKLDVSTGFIKLNTGLTGLPPETLQSGIIVGRGDEEPYVFLYDETDNTFRIGIATETSTGYLDASTQAVVTREDSPTINGIAIWNDAENRFDTFSSITYTDINGLDVDVSLKLDSYSGASDLMLVVGTDGYVKAVPTSDASINDIYTYIDGSLALRDIQIAQLDASIVRIDGDITNINNYQSIQDGSISTNTGAIVIIDGSITYLTNITNIHDVSIGTLYNITDQLDSSIIRIDGSINDLYTQLIAQDTSVKGAINIGDGSAAVYAGITNDGSLQFREFVGVGAAIVSQNGDLIEISIDASFGGEVNTASNIGTGEGLAVAKEGQDLPFKSINTLDPSTVIITSDSSTIYIDVSINAISDASLVGLTDTSINESVLNTHTNIEYDAVSGKWINTDNIWWDSSLATTTDDLGGITQGTNLEGLTLKEILYKILYEYQVPTLSIIGDPIAGIYEKGLVTTQFSSIDVSWNATNANYPLAKLNNITISKTGSGIIYEASLGLVDSDNNSYTDSTGITNWGGINRTIVYNVSIDDDQSEQSQPAITKQLNYSFYYRQYWGVVDGNTNVNQVDSDMIKGLSDSRLAGETDLNATFTNPGTGFIKYLFAYPDTVAAPDNFGLLSEITDQNEFNITDSFNTENEDVSVGGNNIRYRFYLSKNKIDTSEFDVTFKF